ncbi:MAG: ribose-phosphate diphosphokinase [Candidatus Thermoplasmatota archaeon]|nr:ribose-phosphate diphosphokinase [Candidatus Thermoplasmatota archaeon]MCL5954517.1 ribose-phosphate diphosphokinase [Candidatus Thermoplasmatota archaeon]
MIIVPAGSSLGLAAKVAKEMGATLADVERKRFPDGEMYVRILTDTKGAEVAVIGNTRSDADFVELLFLLNAAREAGASHVTAVLPYFGYSRQHMVYKPGEPVSSKVMTRAIENFSDRIICVEMHDEETIGFASHPLDNLSVIRTSSEYFRDMKIDLILSPDDGGYGRAKKMAEILSIPAYYINKKRIDARTVEMHLPEIDFSGKSILIVDDIISTGGTIIKAVKLLKDNGASRISVSAVHGVFAKDSDKIIEPLVDLLAVSDTIDGDHSLISVAGDISRALAGDE